MKAFVEQTARALADHPADVEVVELAGSSTSVLELRCHKDDLGRIIGKNGSTISAVRNLVSVLAAKEGRKAVLEVVE